MVAGVVQRPGKPDEIRRDEPGALVDQLVKGVLAVGARFAPDDRPGLVAHPAPAAVDAFAVGFHVGLLQIGRETVKVLFVGKHRVGLGAEKIVVPDAQERHDDRHVPLEGRIPEMVVHGVEALQERHEMIIPDGDHQWKARWRT